MIDVLDHEGTVSLFTTSKLTRGVLIRGALQSDNTPVTYCLLL